MAIPFRLKDEAALNALDETLRTHYRRNDDGTYDIEHTDAEGRTFENVAGLKGALNKERDNAKAAATRVRELEEQLASSDRTALLAELESQRTETAARDARIADLVAGGEMREALAKHRGNPHTMIPVLKTMTKVENGKVVVLDDAGKLREGITVDALVAELRDRDAFSSAFAGSGQSGGGTTGGDTSKGGTRSTLSLAGRKRSTMTPGEKARAIKELGSVDEFMKLQW